MRSLELFAGAGGLALGVDRSGFKHSAVVEFNRNACGTIRENHQRGVIDWPLFEADVRGFDYSPYENQIDLLAGGLLVSPSRSGASIEGMTIREISFRRRFARFGN